MVKQPRRAVVPQDIIIAEQEVPDMEKNTHIEVRTCAYSSTNLLICFAACIATCMYTSCCCMLTFVSSLHATSAYCMCSHKHAYVLIHVHEQTVCTVVQCTTLVGDIVRVQSIHSILNSSLFAVFIIPVTCAGC
jgi:hypothetical protein